MAAISRWFVGSSSKSTSGSAAKARASVARRMGIEGAGAEAGEILLEEFGRHRERVREVYDRLLGRFAPPD